MYGSRLNTKDILLYKISLSADPIMDRQHHQGLKYGLHIGYKVKVTRILLFDNGNTLLFCPCFYLVYNKEFNSSN